MAAATTATVVATAVVAAAVPDPGPRPTVHSVTASPTQARKGSKGTCSNPQAVQMARRRPASDCVFRTIDFLTWIGIGSPGIAAQHRANSAL